MSQPDFERRLQALLERAVKADPQEPDMMPALRRRLTPAARWRLAPAASRHPILAVVSTLVLVSLFVVSFVWLRPGSPGGGGPTGQPTKSATQSPVPERRVDGGGITFHIEAIYADVTRTVVQYSVAGAATAGLIPVNALLSGNQGESYDLFAAGWSAQSGGLIEFAPLPPEAVGQPQVLTVTVKNMQTRGDAASEATIYDGIWSDAAQATLQGAVHSLAVAPQSHGGIAIQPFWLAKAPAPSAIDGVPGGVVVVLQMSGLPGDTQVASLTDFTTAFTYVPLVPPTPGHATMTLQAAGGVTGTLGLLRVLTPHDETVLPKGTVGGGGPLQVQVIFFGGIPDPLTSVTLSIDRLPLMRVGLNGSLTPAAVEGPWTFELPLA